MYIFLEKYAMINTIMQKNRREKDEGLQNIKRGTFTGKL